MKNVVLDKDYWDNYASTRGTPGQRAAASPTSSRERTDMARARNIKPGFFRNADLAELSIEARLLFVGLWTIADRAGRLEDRPKQIKIEVSPADNNDCDALLDAIAATGMLVRYQANGVRYLQVVNFAKHQNPHKEERASTIPAPYPHHANPVQALCRHQASQMQTPCQPG